MLAERGEIREEAGLAEDLAEVAEPRLRALARHLRSAHESFLTSKAI